MGESGVFDGKLEFSIDCLSSYFQDLNTNSFVKPGK